MVEREGSQCWTDAKSDSSGRNYTLNQPDATPLQELHENWKQHVGGVRPARW